VPEGDTLHRVARRLQALVGERVHVDAPHPRAAATGVAPRLDGRRLEAVEARGKNLLLSFEGGYVLRSHLRMSGSWRVLPTTAKVVGTPWLVVRGSNHQAVLRGGSVLELTDRHVRSLGPDILDYPPALREMVGNLRRTDQRREVGDALLDQRLVSGIGNVWRAEALWEAQVSPWRSLGELTDEELLRILSAASKLMRRAADGAREHLVVYRRAGRPCPRCGEAICSRGQGDANRIVYWCPGCQRGEEAWSS
jgi:endonuclease-8